MFRSTSLLGFTAPVLVSRRAVAVTFRNQNAHERWGTVRFAKMSAFRIVHNNEEQPVLPQETLIATARAITPMRRPSSRQDRARSFTEEQPLPSQRRTDLMAPRRVGFWSLVPYMAAFSALAFTVWLGAKRFKARQARLVDEFGEVMIYYGNSLDSMRQISSDYKRMLGPGILRGAMFSSYLKNLVTEKPVGPTAIRDTAIVKKLLKIGDKKAATLINTLGTDMKSSPSLLGKLLFLSERVLPISQLPELKLVSLFPYGSGTVVELQRNMAERCFREIVEKEIEDHDAATPPLEPAKILRLEEHDAKSIFDSVITARAKARKAEAAAIAAAEAEDASKPLVEELDHPARSGEPAKVAVHAYQCTVCGYTMFPAAGREFKFYGADFACPTCGAPKDKFVDINEE